jgi:hypothetical protein
MRLVTGDFDRNGMQHSFFILKRRLIFWLRGQLLLALLA